ncbi:MAG TPA: hypothetical protein VLZ75_05105 [Chitinophagales bacterium]|nr:hypothetical protein [Chitinophagales bacterium]
MKYLILLLSALAIFSCNENESSIDNTMESIFDLKSFVHQEIETYKNSSCSIYKEGEVNGISEQKSISSEDFKWDKELRVLSNMDIRKSSWVDYIIIDTLFNEENGPAFTVRYQTINKKIPIKRLEVSYFEEEPSVPFMIEAERSIDNWIFKSKQKIYYTCGIGLRAEGFQKVLWLEKKEFNITTLYNCKNESN